MVVHRGAKNAEGKFFIAFEAGSSEGPNCEKIWGQSLNSELRKNSGDKWEGCQGSEKEWEDNMETTLDEFGRIVIPKEIRDDLNLKPGSRIRNY